MLISNIMRNVTSLTAEAERVGLFYNGKELKAIRTTLKEMGYPQQANEIITKNSTANGNIRVTI